MEKKLNSGPQGRDDPGQDPAVRGEPDEQDRQTASEGHRPVSRPGDRGREDGDEGVGPVQTAVFLQGEPHRHEKNPSDHRPCEVRGGWKWAVEHRQILGRQLPAGDEREDGDRVHPPPDHGKNRFFRPVELDQCEGQRDP